MESMVISKLAQTFYKQILNSESFWVCLLHLFYTLASILIVHAKNLQLEIRYSHTTSLLLISSFTITTSSFYALGINSDSGTLLGFLIFDQMFQLGKIWLSHSSLLLWNDGKWSSICFVLDLILSVIVSHDAPELSSKHLNILLNLLEFQ